MEPGLLTDAPHLSHDVPAGKIHLLCGPTASGKTALAREIEGERGAVRFSIDERMVPPNFPEQRDDHLIERLIQDTHPVFLAILKESHQQLGSGREVVLDVGAFNRSTRDLLRSWATGIRQPLILYYLSVSKDIRLERLRQRNKCRGSDYSFDVPLWVFDLIDQVFEAPTADEGPIIIPG
jgi:predicted kinase